MTEHEADEADLALLRFIDLMRDLGISAMQAIIVATDRIPELYAVASDDQTLH